MTAFFEIAGWTLIHFVWQGAVIGALAAAAFRVAAQRSPNARYVIGCVGLAAMLAAPIVTAQLLSSDPERRFHSTSEEAIAGRRSAGVSAEDRIAINRFGPSRASASSRTSSRDNRLSIVRSNVERRFQAYLPAERVVRSVTIAPSPTFNCAR